MSPQRLSGRRFAAFVAALAVAASAFGGLVLPRLADGELPASLKAPARAEQTPIQQKLEDGRCPSGHDADRPGT